MANNVARAYFNAPRTSSVFVELCEEDRGPEDEGVRITFGVNVRHEICSQKLAEMLHALAVQLWILSGSLGKRACSDTKNVTFSWLYTEMTSSVDIEDLSCLESMLKEKFEITTDIIGQVHHSGWHPEMIVKELGLGAKTLS